MAQHLKQHRNPPPGFPSWAEFASVTLLVLWLVGTVAVAPPLYLLHLLPVVAFSLLAYRLWRGRPRRRDR